MLFEVADVCRKSWWQLSLEM